MNAETKKIVAFQKWLLKEGRKNWGRRCKSYVPFCGNCWFWKTYDEVKVLAEEYLTMDKTEKGKINKHLHKKK